MNWSPAVKQGDAWVVREMDDEAALRLLAAQASHRLRWKWRIDTATRTARTGSRVKGHMIWSISDEGDAVLTTHLAPTSIDPLAALHGKFLLEDAIREAA